MKTYLQQTKLTLLLGLLALSGLTAYAYRTSEYWRGSAKLAKQSTAILSPPLGRNAASPVITLTSAADTKGNCAKPERARRP